MSFSTLVKDLQKELKSNIPQIRFLLMKNPALGYTTINDIATRIGKKYNMVLSLNFPQKEKINDFDSYGTENLSMVINKTKKVFPIKRDLIKSKAKEIFDDVNVEDAYMYEGKEGVKVFFDSGRMDILPHSLHVWCKFDQKVTEYCDWLFTNCYYPKPGVDGAKSEVSS
ncbi:MAG: hypothetical protein ACREAE_03595 [Nitrosopumilaceae archaeon]